MEVTDFLFTSVQAGPGAHPLPLAQRLGQSTVLPLLPFCVFMACYKETFAFNFTIYLPQEVFRLTAKLQRQTKLLTVPGGSPLHPRGDKNTLHLIQQSV